MYFQNQSDSCIYYQYIDYNGLTRYQLVGVPQALIPYIPLPETNIQTNFTTTSIFNNEKIGEKEDSTDVSFLLINL